jgi:hypothetical protein
MQRAEIRCTLPWSLIARELAALKAVSWSTGERTTVQQTKDRRRPLRDSEKAWCINAQADHIGLRSGRRPCREIVCQMVTERNFAPGNAAVIF